MCLSHITWGCPVYFFWGNVHIKNAVGINKDPYLFNSGDKNLVKVLSSFLYFLTPPSQVVRFSVLIIFFQGRSSQFVWSIGIPVRCTLMSPVLPLFLSSFVQLDAWDNLSPQQVQMRQFNLVIYPSNNHPWCSACVSVCLLCFVQMLEVCILM